MAQVSPMQFQGVVKGLFSSRRGLGAAMTLIDVLILPVGCLLLILGAAALLIFWNRGRPDRRG